MNRRHMICILTACIGITALSGCSSENKKTYKQACADLEQGSYEYALNEYQTLVSAGYKTAESYRGAGIASLHLGNYQEAIDYFTSGLDDKKAGKVLKKDMLSYRATAELKAENYDAAMSDCQTLATDYTMDADTYYLTGCVALAMDSYDEASANFTNAYNADSGYDMALQIYETYVENDMEADGTSYLEKMLETTPKDAEDYCERGRAYYYMEDYENAISELTEAVNKDSSEAMLLLGMVYIAQNDTANARTMYQQYIDSDAQDTASGYNGLAMCDINEGAYDSALQNITKGLENATTSQMQDLLYNEIVVYEKQLDFSTALAKAEEYMSMFPDDENVAKEVTFLKSRTGTLES